MDFYTRKNLYLIILICFITLIPIFYTIFGFVSPGLDINANLDLKSTQIEVYINNNSSHRINNIIIFMNDIILEDINYLDPNENYHSFFPIIDNEMELIINSDNHLQYSQTFSVNKDLLSNKITFKPSYLFNKVNEISDFNLQLCNLDSEVNLNVNIIQDAQLIKGLENENVTLNNECKYLYYQLLFDKSGEKTIKFKIYNDVYSKEILITGYVN